MTSKKDNLTEEAKKYIRDMLMPEIEKLDLEAWQEACKSFGPFSYKETTRKAWFEKNKEKIPTAKKIIRFHDKHKSVMKKDEKLKEFKLKASTNYMIELIREAQEEAGIVSNRINSVKVATFRTLVKFDKDPSKLEEGPYEGKEELPEDIRVTRTYRRGRKKEKGEPVPPELVLDTGEALVDGILKVSGKIINNFIHPYQNISISFEGSPEIILKKSKDYKVIDGELTIDFLPTSLKVEPYEKEISLEFKIGKKVKSYNITSTITYDNCDTGLREEEEPQSHRVQVS
ncbi:MAG: hypothetical protein BAJATHORv1_20207 [Candidatus Thorarchaeota archaeon]|nr:MAG: hypothetical protein BAJATHORv1_20207 [Candidatus Thorarchaeota archaeon]